MIEFKKCPGCGRPTFAKRVKTPDGTMMNRRRQDLPPEDLALVVRLGAVQDALKDGTCIACWMLQTDGYRKRAKPKTDQRYIVDARRRATEEELEICRRSIQAYWENRRRRGIPEDGLPVSTLDNGGLYYAEVI